MGKRPVYLQVSCMVHYSRKVQMTPSLLIVATQHGTPFICWLISAILLTIALVTCRPWWGPNQVAPTYNSAFVVAGILFFVLGFLLPQL